MTKGAELYSKLMLQEKNEGSFKFFNIPLGPDSARGLATGTEINYLSDKDMLKDIIVEESPSLPELWKLCEYNLLYDIKDYTDEIKGLFKKIKINKKSQILDTCVGPGFFTTELLKEGYNISTADKNKYMIEPFEQNLKNLGIKHNTTISSWINLKKHFKNNYFDLLFNRGNTMIYANGGWNEEVAINKKESIKAIKKTLKIYHDLLKKGGYLYVDKYKDSEIPSEKMVANLKITKTKEKKGIFFYVDRQPENNVRFAKLILREDNGKDKEFYGKAYDLTEDEMESLLIEVGFKVEKLKLNSEKHFVVWLARK